MNWQSIDTAPKDLTLVDLWIEWPDSPDGPAHGSRMTDMFWNGENWASKYSFGLWQYSYNPRATHWLIVTGPEDRP